MNTKILKITGVLLAITILAAGLMAFSQPVNAPAPAYGRGGGGGGRGGNGNGDGNPGGGYSLTPLTDSEKDALNKAILEEYGAFNLYQSVIVKFGQTVPFSQIVNAEQQHISALTRQATKYGLSIPANPGLANPPVFKSLSEACAAGVAAEKADAALYDQLKPSVTHMDILNVFSNLQSASLNNHLPAFQACQ